MIMIFVWVSITLLFWMLVGAGVLWLVYQFAKGFKE